MSAKRNIQRKRGSRLRGVWLAMVCVFAMAFVARADRTQLKPGWNLFSPQQDVQIGQQQAQQVSGEMPMLNSARVDNYLNQLGQRLAAHGPYNQYTFQFHCVNSPEINAFALPGGFVFVNRGTIEAADDEAQLAGVMAHEISHVLLRHGTNQASKAYAAQVPLALLGGLMGGGTAGGLVEQLGAGVGVNSLFLKFSRTDETQADVLGTQILQDTGYDSRAMAQFFEKIQAESKGQPVQFFSDHPNPDNRIGRVDEEISRLGGALPNAQTDSPKFHEIKTLLKSLPPPPGTHGQGSANSQSGARPAPGTTVPSQPATVPSQTTTASSQTNSIPARAAVGGRPELPSNQFLSFMNSDVRFQYPDNWQPEGQGNTVTLAPPGGIANEAPGNALVYGMLMGVYQPSGGNNASLEQATNELIQQICSSNPGMSVTQTADGPRVDGNPSLAVSLTGVSPAGGEERDWLVTVMRPDGLHSFLGVAPAKDYPDYDSTFQSILTSVHFNH